MNTSHEQTWKTYTSSWKAPTATERKLLYEASLDPACVYTDPLVTTKGWAPLLDYMEDFHKQVPGGHFVTTHFQAHHNRSIATWKMVDGEGTPLGEGISYGEYNDAGKLVSMTGFFETPEG